MKNLILSKSSNEEQIKMYFQKVLELKQSGEEFPINLDEVWMLVYTKKDNAVRALMQSDYFVKDYDFKILLPQNEEQDKWGGHNKNDYKLSVQCFEFFIAKKVRPVFEVYRNVFHKAIELQHQLTWQGMPTIYDNGKVYCNYMGCLRTFNYSTRSGAVAARKRIYADSFKKFFNQNFITVAFAEELKKQSEIRQLKLEFEKTIDIMTDVVKIDDKELRVSIANKIMGKA